MTQPEQPSFRVPRWVFRGLNFWFRTAYKFELEGVERLPQGGPLLLLPTDIQGFLGPMAQMLALPPIMRQLRETPVRQVSFLHEQLYALIAKRMSSKKAPVYGVRPHDAGTLGLSLLDGYRALKEGGLVNLNPEGDQSWDGVSVGIKPGCAWLALRTGAPCVLVVPTAGIYDIWPFWERLPSLRGRMSLRYSEPFTVTDQPLDRVTDEDLARAKGIIAARLDALRHGPEGVGAWAEPPRLHGKPLSELPQLRQPGQARKAGYRRVSAKKQGIGLLLFQCPICGTTDSLVHRRSLVGAHRVVCRACAAKWHVQRQYGKDFRLVLKRGPAELLGLDVALSQLHDYVKQYIALDPAPIEPAIELADDERTLLVANKCKIMPYDTALLQNPPSDGLAPTVRTEDHLAMPSQDTLGVGELAMTDRRLVWRQNGRRIEFEWSKVSALHFYFRNVMTIAHGSALYTLNLGDEGAIKWMAYADKLLNGDDPARRVPVSPY